MLFRALILVITTFAAGGCNGSSQGDDGAPVRERGRCEPDRDMMRGMMDRMMANMPEGVPASTLPDPGSRGARLVARYCSQCHGIPSPARQSAEDWEPTVRRMVDRMARM
ncbi:MAG TPA: hypothetical protein VF188_18730, partial [Longimicrobiales bacterium]